MRYHTDKIEATVETVLYPKPGPDGAPVEPTWYILRTDRGVCKGEMSWRPEDGERLRLEGRWDVYRGQREFKFTLALPNVPVDPRDALRYACERTRGMGPAFELAVWEAKGDDWPAIRAGDVPRLKGDLYLRFRETIDMLAREAEKSNAIAWLMGKGATAGMASAAWEKWEKATVGVVKANCYQLAELPHYGFVHVDSVIRGAFGIGEDDPRRIRAAVVHALRTLTGQGDTTVTWPELRDRANQDLRGCYTEALAEHVRAMFGGALCGFVDSGRIALGTDYRNEKAIWEFAQTTQQGAQS